MNRRDEGRKCVRSVRGLTLLEVVVGFGVFTLVLMLMQEVGHLTRIGSDSAVEHNEAIRSSQLALETIRHDVERMIYQDEEHDVEVDESGKGLTMTVPTFSDSDPWEVTSTPVAYSIQKVASTTSTYTLQRKEKDEKRTIQGVLLHDLQFRSVKLSGTATDATHLEIVCVGTGSTGSRHLHAASLLLPLRRVARPSAYSVKGGQS